MKFLCDKEHLLNGINIVQKAVSSKTTLPILEGILIETGENKIKLTSNDLEIGIECYIESKIIESGTTVIESRMFGEIIRRLPDSDIFITQDQEGIFTIECGGALYKLSSLKSEEFPRLPEINTEESLVIKQNILKEMIRQTIFSVSMDENRPIFTGCLIEIKGEKLNIVSVDGFRLSLRSYSSNWKSDNFYAIIPGKTLNEVFKILQNNDEDVKINISKNQALFEIENCKIVSRLLEGEFLNYESAVPVEKETRIKLNKENLLSAFERVYLLTSKEDKKFPVKMLIEKNLLTITCSSSVGNAKEILEIDVEGNDLEIGFNPKYFIDALKVISEEEVYIDFTTNMAPCVIKPIKGEDFVYMILPVRIKE
jgi:DNA polymerase-3 subunit beta